ncbi:hypothetical protein SNE25_09610 [Mucilaginibacter sabulilitoris]|uniref:Uncharacterized protein n=1 Tax=Mucilaginibacter sabulilitoris TaxID=1173583 RepID=A0ABZ0TRN0_9SPHI|nr:hypothetical protein [Mucilaginibacter sabulilitoris]WPU95774.1 hypothetical protein SNE25_09610 [Mucilaginibacter sabulilitoris]
MSRKTPFKNRLIHARAQGMAFILYSKRGTAHIARLLDVYPRLSYAAMLFCIALSVVIMLFFRHNLQNPQAEKIQQEPSAGFPTGLGQLLATGRDIKELLELKKKIDELLAKDSLSAEDSLLLRQARRKLQNTHHQIKKIP